MLAITSLGVLLGRASRTTSIEPVPGIDEGARCARVPSTAGSFAAWRPRPARHDISRGIAFLGAAYCAGSGEVFDAGGAHVWNASHKQRRRRAKSWVLDRQAVRRCARGTALELDRPLLNLATSNGSMYFHWLLDVLPRLHIARRTGLEHERLIYASCDRAFQRETLAALGVADRVVDATAHPLVRAPDVVSPCHQLACGHLPPRWVLAFLRDELRPLLEVSPSPYGERIYVSRRDATRRRIVNEDALMEELAPLGFRLVVPGRMGFADQIACFAAARTIVAVHGSALANLAFCARNARLIELFPNAYFDDGPYRLAMAMGVDYRYVRERVNRRRGLPIERDFEIDPRDVLATLALAERRNGRSESQP